jgi:hypothetical protein
MTVSTHRSHALVAGVSRASVRKLYRHASARTQAAFDGDRSANSSDGALGDREA